MTNEEENKAIIKWSVIGGVVVVVLIALVILNPIVIVSAGQKGIKTQFGAVVGVVDNGLSFKTPIIQSVIKINIQTQKEQIDAESASSDLQNVKATIALNYNLYPDKVGELYAKIGTDYKTRIIDPAIQEAVKSATAKYTAEQLITKRAEVRDAIKSNLTARLANEYIQVTEVSIVNFDFSASFNQAIEAKVTAEQNALAAKNKLEQIKFEAQQTIESAKAQAESIKIQANAINSQGGADYVNLKAIEKWDGKLPTQMIPGATVPILKLN